MVATSLLFQWHPSLAGRNSRGVVHETAADLHDADLMDKRTLRKLNELCLTPVCPMCPDQIRAIRERENQAVFALYLNASTGTVKLTNLSAYSAPSPLSKLLILHPSVDRFRLQNSRFLLNLTIPEVELPPTLCRRAHGKFAPF